MEEWRRTQLGEGYSDTEFAEDLCRALAKDLSIHPTQIYLTDRFDALLLPRAWWGYGRFSDDLPNYEVWLDELLEERIPNRKTREAVQLQADTIGGLLVELKSYLNPSRNKLLSERGVS